MAMKNECVMSLSYYELMKTKTNNCNWAEKFLTGCIMG